MDELKQYVKNLWKLDPKLATLLSFVENSILADEAVPSVWWDEWGHEEKAWQRQPSSILNSCAVTSCGELALYRALEKVMTSKTDKTETIVHQRSFADSKMSQKVCGKYGLKPKPFIHMKLLQY